MLFNSIEYLFFFFIFIVLYWSLANKKLIFQNVLLLIASYVFYGWWDYRFLILIFISTFVDFFIARKIHLTQKTGQKKLLSNFLTTLNEKKGFVIVLVNYPYNLKYDIKELRQSSLYNFFNNHNLPNLKIFQSPLITNKRESVDWRNVHPNSSTMLEVFNFIKQEILNKNENTNPSSAKTKTSPAQ